MIDICTLIVAQTMTLQACISPVICKSILDNDGNTIKEYCTQDFSNKYCSNNLSISNKYCSSNNLSMWYECKRKDGSIYTEEYK